MESLEQLMYCCSTALPHSLDVKSGWPEVRKKKYLPISVKVNNKPPKCGPGQKEQEPKVYFVPSSMQRRNVGRGDSFNLNKTNPFPMISVGQRRI